MKLNEVLQRIQAGERILIGEYRSSKCETINWRDKVSGKPLSAAAVRHVVEFGPDSVVIAERTAENFEVAKFKAPASKGQKVACHFTEFLTERGVMSARGTLEVIE